MLRFLVALAMTGLLLGCGDESAGPRPVPGCDLPCQLAKSPFPDAEAEAAAVYLGRGVVAPESLYTECRDALTKLRAQFEEFDSSWWTNQCEFCGGGERWENSVDLTFRFPWGLGKLVLYFNNDSSGQAVLAGTYHNWDSLNSFYRVDSLKAFPDAFGPYAVEAHLYFHGRLNGKLLVPYYRQLQGVVDVEYLNHILTDGSVLYFGRDSSGRICFVGDFGWGDCPSGCSYHKSYFFKQQWNAEKRDFNFVFVGSYLIALEPEPDWWPEATQIKDAWWNYWKL